jgi:tRNA(adenine34) deaminase
MTLTPAPLALSEAGTPWSTAMARALEEADAAAADGDVPVGAIMVPPFDVALKAEAHLIEALGRAIPGRNLREKHEDPTAHAEIVALRGAAAVVGRWRLDGWTCVVTLEPCPMCAGALVNARVARVVFGCRDPKAGACRSLYEITSDPRLNHRLEIVEGVEREACAERLRAFFAARRRKARNR